MFETSTLLYGVFYGRRTEDVHSAQRPCSPCNVTGDVVARITISCVEAMCSPMVCPSPAGSRQTHVGLQTVTGASRPELNNSKTSIPVLLGVNTPSQSVSVWSVLLNHFTSLSSSSSRLMASQMWTLNPKPEPHTLLNPKPNFPKLKAPNPEPQTLKLKPQTLNPKP